MDEKLYRPEPIQRRPHRPDSGPARLSRTPMNGSRPDARDAIARIMADSVLAAPSTPRRNVVRNSGVRTVSSRT